MAFTYSLATDIGKIRLLIFDANAVRYVFEDEELTIFLGMEASRIKRAAALALETMASNENFVQKAIRLLDLSTDGAKVAAEMRARAAILRKQDADDLVTEEVDDSAGFEIAEWPLGPASHRDYIDRWGYGDA